MDCSLPGSFVHGIFQARILEWVAISYSKGIFPTQGLNPSLLHYLHWQILYHWATWEAPEDIMPCKVSHLQEDKDCMTPIIRGPQRSHIHRDIK